MSKMESEFNTYQKTVSAKRKDATEGKANREVWEVCVSTLLHPWPLHKEIKQHKTVHHKMSKNSSTTDYFWTYIYIYIYIYEHVNTST